MKRVVAIILVHLSALMAPGVFADESAFAGLFQRTVPLQPSGSGSFTVTATLAGVEADFLLDTGASMVTLTRDVFEQVRARGGVSEAGQVAARTASGRLETLYTYRVEKFTLGECQLGPLEVAVLKRGGRNLLGMSALSRSAPFAVSTTPPALGLSHCGSENHVAGR